MRQNAVECNEETAKSAEHFGFAFASDSYRDGVEKTPQLKSLYQDHASYMQVWSEIEKARHHHMRQEYGLAKEHFEKATDNLQSVLRKRCSAELLGNVVSRIICFWNLV